jgi:hypothetical protein
MVNNAPKDHHNHQRGSNSRISSRSHPDRRLLASQSSQADHERHSHRDQANGRQWLGRNDAGWDQEGESRDKGDNCGYAKGAVCAAIGSTRRVRHDDFMYLDAAEQRYSLWKVIVEV